MQGQICCKVKEELKEGRGRLIGNGLQRKQRLRSEDTPCDGKVSIARGNGNPARTGPRGPGQKKVYEGISGTAEQGGRWGGEPLPPKTRQAKKRPGLIEKEIPRRGARERGSRKKLGSHFQEEGSRKEYSHPALKGWAEN